MVSWPIRSAAVNMESPLFHREAFRFVCQVGRACVEDRVVIATAKFDIDFTGDCTSNPALSGFAKHDGLRVEPAALIKKTAEFNTVDSPLFDGVFVMDTGNETFESDVKQCHSRGFVNAAALGFDDAVFDLVAHTQAVTSADAVGFEHQLDLVVKFLAVQCNRNALFETDGDFSQA